MRSAGVSSGEDAWEVELRLPEGATVGEAIADLAERYESVGPVTFNETGRLLVGIVHNGHVLRTTQAFLARLADGDHLFLLPLGA